MSLWLGKSPGKAKSYSFQCSGLKNSMNCIVHGVAKSQTRLSDFHFTSLGRNDAKAETPVLWPPHAKSSLIGKDSDAGRDWGQEEKGTTEDEMAGWHH